jgi:hypothetical protein
VTRDNEREPLAMQEPVAWEYECLGIGDWVSDGPDDLGDYGPDQWRLHCDHQYPTGLVYRNVRPLYAAPVITADERAAIRKAALEEAAKLLDERAAFFSDRADDTCDEIAKRTVDYAYEVRALIDQKPEDV